MPDNKIEKIIIETPKSSNNEFLENNQEKISSKAIETEKKDKKLKKSVSTAILPTSSFESEEDNINLKQLKEIENIMSSGLDQVFLQMNPEQQKRFKEEGEKTASKINVLLNKAKIEIKKIISLIKRWLSLIPHVNKFFLEQEAKIKADNILKIKRKL